MHMNTKVRRVLINTTNQNQTFQKVLSKNTATTLKLVLFKGSAVRNNTFLIRIVIPFLKL